jgi:hypothetical protein
MNDDDDDETVFVVKRDFFLPSLLSLSLSLSPWALLK